MPSVSKTALLTAILTLAAAEGTGFGASSGKECETQFKGVAAVSAATDPDRQYVALWDDFADQFVAHPATQGDLSDFTKKVTQFQADYDAKNGKGAFGRFKAKQIDGLKDDFQKTKDALDGSKAQGHSFKSFAVRHAGVARKLAAWQGLLLRQDPQKPWIFEVVPVRGVGVLNAMAAGVKRRFNMRVVYDYGELMKEDSGGFYSDEKNTLFLSPYAARDGKMTDTEMHELRHGVNAALEKARKNSVLWTSFTADEGTKIDPGLDIYDEGLSSDEFSAYSLTLQGLKAEVERALKLPDGSAREDLIADAVAGFEFPLEFYAHKSEIVRAKLKEDLDLLKSVDTMQESRNGDTWTLTDAAGAGKNHVSVTRDRTLPDGGADFTYEVKVGNVAFGGPIFASKDELAAGGAWAALGATSPSRAEIAAVLSGQIGKLDAIIADAQKRAIPAQKAFQAKDWPTLLRLLNGFRL